MCVFITKTVNEETILNQLYQRNLTDCRLVEMSSRKSQKITAESKRAFVTAYMSSNVQNEIIINIKDKVDDSEDL